MGKESGSLSTAALQQHHELVTTMETGTWMITSAPSKSLTRGLQGNGYVCTLLDQHVQLVLEGLRGEHRGQTTAVGEVHWFTEGHRVSLDHRITGVQG